MSKGKKIALHCAAWAVWNLLALSWVIFSGTPQPIIPLAYNVVTLILVFYGVRWMASIYWRKIEAGTAMYVGDKGLNLIYPRLRFYILQWPLGVMIAIVLGYVGLSWLAEGLFVEMGYFQGRTPNFYYFTFSRWSVESLYVCGGNVMAAIEYHLRKEKEKERVLEEGYAEQYRQNQLHTQKLRGVISEYSRVIDEMRRHMKKTPPNGAGDRGNG